MCRGRFPDTTRRAPGRLGPTSPKFLVAYPCDTSDDDGGDRPERYAGRRAPSAAEYLIEMGVTGEIDTKGVGQTDLRVPTPDEVEEQENRNVQIRIN